MRSAFVLACTLALVTATTTTTAAGPADVSDATAIASETTFSAVTHAESVAPELPPEYSCPTQIVPPVVDSGGALVTPAQVKLQCSGCDANPFRCIDEFCGIFLFCTTFFDPDCFFGIGGPWICICTIRADSPLRWVARTETSP